ncbi:MAG: hypothetical protein M1840_005357 [Geoglossum simile]|nr:MAG: hypothetical protein M1840_005357 [Geoglossum simile]
MEAGQKIVHFRRRYFVYRNCDGQPDALGDMLVRQIPTDPERYNRQFNTHLLAAPHIAKLTYRLLSADWLENERAIYAQMTEEIESRALTVTDETMYAYGSKNEGLLAWQTVDDRLEELPGALGVQSEIERWQYTIDLDREVFSVNMWVHFHLDNIPREWKTGFKHYGRTIFSFKAFPEAKTIQPATIAYFANNCSRAEYKAKYQQYDCSIVRAPNRIEECSRVAHRQIIAIAMFEKFMSNYAFNFEAHLSEWGDNDFAFRESCFAILSFATGQYRFDEPLRLNGEIDNGYLMEPDNESLDDGDLADGVYGCHRPGEEAGSAPQASIYWFENVLVSLVPDIVVQSDTEAAIAKVVESGLREGKLNFYAVVFSLINVVMLQVIVENEVTTIKRTETIELDSSAQDTQSVDQLEAYFWRRAGFISLMHFFNAAANQHLSLRNRGCFPREICQMILVNTDERTYSACAKASMDSHTYAQENVLFGKDLMIIKFSTERDARRSKWNFTFLDRNTGAVRELRFNEKGATAIWSPIIGAERPSIITRIELPFSTRSVPIRKSRRERYFSDGFRNIYLHRDLPLNLSPNATLAQIEEVLGLYLQNFFKSNNAPRRYWSVDNHRYPCTLIPHYREISIRCYYLSCSLQVCLRRPIDGDSPQKRAETLAYVTKRLSEKAKDGVPVIVAFGMNVGLYDWRRKDGEWFLESRVHCEDYSLEDSRVEFETKTLLPLKRDLEVLDFAACLRAVD